MQIQQLIIISCVLIIFIKERNLSSSYDTELLVFEESLARTPTELHSNFPVEAALCQNDDLEEVNSF